MWTVTFGLLLLVPVQFVTPADKFHRRHTSPTYCPFSWGEFGDSCYGLRMLSLPWKDAFSECERSKSNLVFITSLAELDFVLQLARDPLVHSTQQSSARIWTGLSTYPPQKSVGNKKNATSHALNWVFTNSSRQPPLQGIIRVLKLSLSPLKTDSSACAYIEIGRQLPNGAGFLSSCSETLPASSGIIHGYICKQKRLPVKGSFVGDYLVPLNSKYADLQLDAVSSDHPVPVAGYWPSGQPIAYEISKNFLDEEKEKIRKALATLDRSVCGLKFREKRSGLREDEDYIYFEHSDESNLCASSLGRFRGKQTVLFGTECFDELGTLMHETMHALGIPHEHQRPDRDRYIKINWDSIEPSKKTQFLKYDKTLPPWQRVAYDLESVMRYRTKDFSIFGAFTTIDVLPGVLNGTKHTKGSIIIGQRKYLSKRDVEKLSNLFPCDASGKSVASQHGTGMDLLKHDQLVPKLKQNPQCVVEFDRDIISGVALQTLGNQPKEACCDLCVADRSCRGFAWNDWQNGTCYLKSAGGPMIQLDGVIAGYVVLRMNESVDDEVSYDDQHCTTLYGIDIHGGDALADISGQYSFACCRLCLDHERCQAYSWIEENGGTCFLKSGTLPQVVAQNVQSGIVRSRLGPVALLAATKSYSAPPNATKSCRLSRGREITPGVNLATHSPRRQGECCNLCGRAPKCRAFVWSEANGGTCYLKSSTTQVQGAAMRVVGFLLQNSSVAPETKTSETTTALALPVDTPFNSQCNYRAGYDVAPGSTFRIVTNQRITACCDLCWSENQCQAFSWVANGNGTCYLKSEKSSMELVSGAFSGFVKLKPCTLVESMDINGGDAITQVSNVAMAGGCCRICQTTAKCKGFAWNADEGGTCWLKTAAGPMI